jgi:heptosyltransferase-3
MSAARQTLVIHPGALGDVLQAVPALRALRRHGPLAFAGQPRLGRLLRGLSVVETALSFDGLGLERLFTEEPVPTSLATRLASFERVISWFGAHEAMYARQLRAVARNSVIATPVPGEQSTLTAWRHLLTTLGTPARHELNPLRLPAIWRDEARRVLAEIGVEPARPLLVVHPGAGARWKLWPVENWARALEEIARRGDAQALIHQGPADRDVVDRLSRVLQVPALKLIEPDLSLLAGVLGGATAYLGPDSGVSHLAAAVGAPAVILFPAATHRRWAPWSRTAHVLPMSDEAGQPERVAAAVSDRLSRSEAPRRRPPKNTAD